MNTSKESTSRITTYYETYGSIFKKEGIDFARNGLYGMHIGYRENNISLGNGESPSKLLEKKIIRDAKVQDGQQILDAGCGTGTLVFEVANTYPNAKVYGIDLLDNHLETASQYVANFPNVFFSKQDYLNLDFKDSCFDRIIFCESLVHARDKNKLLIEALRILKPGGKIIIADVFMLKNNLTEKEKLDLSNFSKETGISRFEDLNIFNQKLKRLGFQNISLQNLTNNLSSTIHPETELNSPNLSILPTQNHALLKLENLLSVVGGLYLNKKTGYFIITADIDK